jgi:hypothetical protein
MTSPPLNLYFSWHGCCFCYPMKRKLQALHPHGPVSYDPPSQNKPRRALYPYGEYHDTTPGEIVPLRRLKTRYSRIKSRADYDALLKSGMLFEFHPELTGDWQVDRDTIWHNVCTSSGHELEDN